MEFLLIQVTTGADKRERAYASRNQQITDTYNAHAHDLPPLELGTNVLVQNKVRKKKWDKSGCIVEVLPHRQYRVRMYPTGRVTLQNRRFLRPSPNSVPAAIIIPSASLPPTSDSSQPLLSPSSEIVQTHESRTTAFPAIPPASLEPIPTTYTCNTCKTYYTNRY